jgi:hypothetical protein
MLFWFVANEHELVTYRWLGTGLGLAKCCWGPSCRFFIGANWAIGATAVDLNSISRVGTDRWSWARCTCPAPGPFRPDIGRFVGHLSLPSL